MLFYYDKMLESLKSYLGAEYVNDYDCEGMVDRIYSDLKRCESMVNLEYIESIDQLPADYFNTILESYEI